MEIPAQGGRTQGSREEASDLSEDSVKYAFGKTPARQGCYAQDKLTISECYLTLIFLLLFS